MKKIYIFYCIYIFPFLVFGQRKEEKINIIDGIIKIEYDLNNKRNISIKSIDLGIFLGEFSSPLQSDASGNYLFYNSKKEIWNELNIFYPTGYNRKMMLGGNIYKNNDVIYGLNDLIVVPQPQTTCNYYIFQTDIGIRFGVIEIDSIMHGFQYHIVNMKGDNGKGEVINKNNQLTDSTCSAIGAIPSRDKKAYWIFSITYPQLCIEVHKLTKSGVKKTQNTFCGGLNHIDIGNLFYQNHRYTHGLPYVEMKMSPTNDKFAIAGTERGYYKVKLFKFNNETGKIEFDYELEKSQNEGLNRITFTADGKYLYFGNSIYNLTKATPEEVQASEYLIGEKKLGN